MNNESKKKETELPVMMYIHGFRSGANGSKRGQLQKHFEGKFRVIAPAPRGCLPCIVSQSFLLISE